MKKIFIKDDRLREIHSDLSDKIAKMLLNGELKGSYIVKEATKEFNKVMKVMERIDDFLE